LRAVVCKAELSKSNSLLNFYTSTKYNFLKVYQSFEAIAGNR